jgi:purine-binding chemotaxis protein CheW
MENEHISANQFLTFILASDQYALEIPRVREVLDYTLITHVPRMPAFLKGVINLRGNVVPVVDLRLCLSLPLTKVTVDTCIVIVQLMIDEEETLVGMLTDSVQEVVDIEPAQIKPPATLGNRLPIDFVKGM